MGSPRDAILDVLCREYSADLAAALLGRYVELLPEWLERRTNGFIHPNVVEILQAAAARDDFENALLTGNLEAGAKLKLGAPCDPGLLCLGRLRRPRDRPARHRSRGAAPG